MEFEVKVGLAEMLQGGVIIDVANPLQARIAEEAGAVAVRAVDSHQPRLFCPEIVQEIQEAISIPVIAKCRIGHLVEAQILEALFVDFIDESEMLPPIDEENYIEKHLYKIPFVCSASDLGEALERIAEGAAMIRTKENSAGIVKELRKIRRQIKQLTVLDAGELYQAARALRAPFTLVQQIAEKGELPVPLFAGGGITTPADAALLVQLGAESIFVDVAIFSHDDAAKRAEMIVAAVSYHQDPEILAKVSVGLIEEMGCSYLKKEDLLYH